MGCHELIATQKHALYFITHISLLTCANFTVLLFHLILSVKLKLPEMPVILYEKEQCLEIQLQYKTPHI